MSKNFLLIIEIIFGITTGIFTIAASYFTYKEIEKDGDNAEIKAWFNLEKRHFVLLTCICLFTILPPPERIYHLIFYLMLLSQLIFSLHE